MITLEFPYVAPVTTLQLPNPELLNTEEIDLGVKVRRSMSGGFHTVLPLNNLTTLTLVFQSITRQQAQNLLNFLTIVAGNDLKYTDMDGVVWQVHFQDDNVTYTSVSRIAGTYVEAANVPINLIGIRIG